MAHLIITDVFPSQVHGLAGAVFNTVSQLGASVGMSAIAIVSHYVTTSSKNPDKHSPEAVMAGYRAAFGICFALMILSCFSAIGLRVVGKLGMGKE
jgi:MFS family permease